ncbi:hypothetical protein Tola_1926 [Tolumonas auensis DSM 9187]|uniref:Uncharacterized protein n=1 Tax=Tolumonas auensis (strain DSM 9187 / NBRC 110442 / TA 4) TaxID=595494 RepID=C4LG10_TOLAT|nr:hypothetical protein [Tolumonas auensis]ACQ93527.1 hypothetical protein Tola_1926 [Tolumonas auensis DSM 9187]
MDNPTPLPQKAKPAITLFIGDMARSLENYAAINYRTELSHMHVLHAVSSLWITGTTAYEELYAQVTSLPVYMQQDPFVLMPVYDFAGFAATCKRLMGTNITDRQILTLTKLATEIIDKKLNKHRYDKDIPANISAKNAIICDFMSGMGHMQDAGYDVNMLHHLSGSWKYMYAIVPINDRYDAIYLSDASRKKGKGSVELTSKAKDTSEFTSLLMFANRLANEGRLPVQFAPLIVDYVTPTRDSCAGQPEYEKVIFQSPIGSTRSVDTVMPSGYACMQFAKYANTPILPEELPFVMESMIELVKHLEKEICS